MADFSKEYCDIWDPEMPYDFSIEEIAKDLHKGTYYPIICEGFGIIGIAKNSNGDILLAVLSDDTSVWIDYLEFINEQLLDKENTNHIINNHGTIN